MMTPTGLSDRWPTVYQIGKCDNPNRTARSVFTSLPTRKVCQASEHEEFGRAEVKRLLKARFIREVIHPDWLAKLWTPRLGVISCLSWTRIKGTIRYTWLRRMRRPCSSA